MTIKRKKKKRRRKREFDQWKKIHQAPHANLDEAVSSAGTDLKSNGAEENRQGSCCPEETPSSIGPSVQPPLPAPQRLTHRDWATSVQWRQARHPCCPHRTRWTGPPTMTSTHLQWKTNRGEQHWRPVPFCRLLYLLSPPSTLLLSLPAPTTSDLPPVPFSQCIHPLLSPAVSFNLNLCFLISSLIMMDLTVILQFYLPVKMDRMWFWTKSLYRKMFLCF